MLTSCNIFFWWMTFTFRIDFSWLSPYIRLIHPLTIGDVNSTEIKPVLVAKMNTMGLVQVTWFHRDDVSCHWDFNRYVVVQAAYKIFDTWILSSVFASCQCILEMCFVVNCVAVFIQNDCKKKWLSESHLAVTR